MREILGNIIRANKIFKMIENNDRIAVGISGGKDSMSLLFALSLYKKRLKEDLGWNIEIIGIHLKLNLCAVDYEQIIDFWKNNGVEFIVEHTKIGEILKENMKKDKLQCSLCSKMKKAALIDAAKRLNCNKVAMGHHADDAIETLFMNMINEGRIATFKPKMFLDRSKIMFIRPLILCRENDIKRNAKKINIPIIPCGCPMEGFTQRDSMKYFLKHQIYDNPKTKSAYKNFFVALMNGKQFDLWFKTDDNKFIDDDLREFSQNNGKLV